MFTFVYEFLGWLAGVVLGIGQVFLDWGQQAEEQGVLGSIVALACYSVSDSFADMVDGINDVTEIVVQLETVVRAIIEGDVWTAFADDIWLLLQCLIDDVWGFIGNLFYALYWPLGEALTQYDNDWHWAIWDYVLEFHAFMVNPALTIVRWLGYEDSLIGDLLDDPIGFITDNVQGLPEELAGFVDDPLGWLWDKLLDLGEDLFAPLKQRFYTLACHILRHLIEGVW